MQIHHLFDEDTFTLTYVVFDEQTKDAVIIDPVLDFEPASGKIRTTALDQLLKVVSDHQLNVKMILETHAHADHISSSQNLKKHFPQAQLAIGEGIKKVQGAFKPLFNFGDWFPTDGSQFDRLLQDQEEVAAGSLKFRSIATPGHTPACVSFYFPGAVFTGDALFMPDFGTGRCDFPDGSATDLYHSIHEKLYNLPDDTKVYVGHDYLPAGRKLAFKSTIGEEKKNNIHLKGNTTENEFVEMREKRDRKLNAPKLLFPSIQVNINAGALPPEESNKKAYVKIPLTVLNPIEK